MQVERGIEAENEAYHDGDRKSDDQSGAVHARFVYRTRPDLERWLMPVLSLSTRI